MFKIKSARVKEEHALHIQSLKFHKFPFPFCEPAPMGKAGLACQLESLAKIHSDLRRRMSVGSESQRDLFLSGHLKNPAAWIHLLAGLSQASGIDLNGHIMPFGCDQKALEERSTILLRIKAEFLGEIGMADDLKKIRLRSLG